MTSPSASPPPPPPPPPHGDEGSSETSNHHYSLEALVDLYHRAQNDSDEDAKLKIMQLTPDQRENVERAIASAYYASKDFIENKIMKSEFEVSALEFRLQETKQLLEMSKNVPLPDTSNQQPIEQQTVTRSSDTRHISHWPSGPKDTMGNQKILEQPACLATLDNPKRCHVCNNPILWGDLPKTIGTCFDLIWQQGIAYFENQMRQTEVELDVARRTLREFQILRDTLTSADRSDQSAAA